VADLGFVVLLAKKISLHALAAQAMSALQDQAVPNNESHQQDVLALSASRMPDTHHVSSVLVVLDFC